MKIISDGFLSITIVIITLTVILTVQYCYSSYIGDPGPCGVITPKTVTVTYDPDEFEIVRKQKSVQFVPSQNRIFKAYTSGIIRPFTLEYRDNGELRTLLKQPAYYDKTHNEVQIGGMTCDRCGF